MAKATSQPFVLLPRSSYPFPSAKFPASHGRELWIGFESSVERVAALLRISADFGGACRGCRLLSRFHRVFLLNEG